MPKRKLIAILGILFLLTAVGLLSLWFAWSRGLFSKDQEDVAEITQLATSKISVTPAAGPSVGWPQWRGPFRDGRAPAGPLRTDWDKSPPKLLWSTPCGGGFSGISEVAGRLFTQDRLGTDERVLCLDAKDGHHLWEYKYPADLPGQDRTYANGPRASPTVEGNRVFSVGGAGKFLCLEFSAGSSPPRVCWQHDLLAEFDAEMPQWGVACSPLIEGDLVVAQPGGKKGSVAAFDKNTGELRWSAGKNPSGYSSPIAAAIGGKRTIFALTGDALLAVTANGVVSDSFSWGTRFLGNIATPIVVNEYVFISAAYGQGCALLRARPQGDGVKLVPVYARHKKGLQNHHSTSVYKDGYVYGFDGIEGRLKCVEFASSNEREDWEAARVGKGCLILASNHLVILTERGELCLVEATPEEFRLVSTLPKVLNGNRNWALPTLVDGRLYLRDDEKVVCYDVAP